MGSPCKQQLAASGTWFSAPGCEPRLHQDGLVHYFWGISFCPAGLDPDLYTPAIVCQLQAYERCLKRAQSRSLRKAEFGPPVLPLTGQAQRPRPQQDLAQPEAPDPGHRGEQPEAQAQSQGTADQLKIPVDTGRGLPQSSSVCAEEMPEDEGGVNSCHSEQEEFEDSGGPGSCASPNVRPGDDVLFVGIETQQSSPEEMHPESEAAQGSDNDSAQEPEDVVLIEDEAEEFPSIPMTKKPCVECPICGQRFPLEKIEVHAADCNGACDGGSELQVQTRSHTRRVAKENSTARSNPATQRL